MGALAKKLVVIGLDGATFRVLDPLIEAGKLDTLARLKAEGASGTLESIRPPISSPAWFCYSTGKNPGKIGIYGWRNFDPETRTDRFNDYSHLEDAEIWDVLGQAGYRSAVVNIPTMFPPKAIEGVMVSGMQAEDHQAYTHPPELKDELVDRFDYRTSPKHKLGWDFEQAYPEVLELFETRFDVARHLVDDVDLLHVTIFHIDELQHTAWGTPELEEAWQRIDALLGAFLDDLPEGTDVLLMSDHGFRPSTRPLCINTWLEQEGYLARVDNPVGEGLRRVGLNRQRLESVVKRLGVLDLAKRVVPEAIQQRIKDEDGSTTQQRRLAEIDWDDTVAFASTNFTMHVLDEDRIDEIVAKLSDLEAPDGTPVFKEVVRADEHLHGDKLRDAPDILFLPNDGFAANDGLGKPLWLKPDETRGDHDLPGIVIAHGDRFDTPRTIEGARLVDLAPTILHYFGLPVPEDMDGDVLEILAEKREVTYTDATARTGAFSDEALEGVEERLRGLGYLD